MDPGEGQLRVGNLGCSRHPGSSLISLDHLGSFQFLSVSLFQCNFSILGIMLNIERDEIGFSSHHSWCAQRDEMGPFKFSMLLCCCAVMAGSIV